MISRLVTQEIKDVVEELVGRYVIESSQTEDLSDIEIPEELHRIIQGLVPYASIKEQGLVRSRELTQQIVLTAALQLRVEYIVYR